MKLSQTPVWCSGGAASDDMAGGDEASFIAAFKLHVTGAFSVTPLVDENLLDTLYAACTIKQP